MTRPWGRSGRLVIGWAILGVALVAAPTSTAQQPGPAASAMGLGPGAQARIRRMLGDLATSSDLGGGYHVGTVAIEGDLVSIGLARGKAAGGEVVGRLELRPRRAETKGGGQVSKSFGATLSLLDGDPRTGEHLERLFQQIAGRDEGTFYGSRPLPMDYGAQDTHGSTRDAPEIVQRDWRTSPPPSEGDHYPALQSLAAAALLLIALLAWVLIRRRRGRPVRARLQLRGALLVTAALQTLILGYWGLYYAGVGQQLIAIVATLGFGFALDLLLRLWTREEGVFHLAVVPLVLSMHLFVWFDEEHFYLAFLVIAVGLLSKVFVQREGRHIFNPSALGISVAGVLCYALPDLFSYVDIAHAFNTPPSMFEVILLLALVTQMRVPIVLVSIGVALVQFVFIGAAGPQVLIPAVHWAPVLLAVVLLATDPATIPRTGLGRLLFGGSYGVLMVGMSIGLEGVGISDFFTKVLPIPVCNLAVPAFDALAGRWEAGWHRWLAPQFNRLHVCAWLVIMVIPWWIAGGKANLFEGAYHVQFATRHIHARNLTATCEDNPVFCDPFSLWEEARLWTMNDGHALW